MAIEAIKEIKKVELQADEMIKKAHEQSKKIISDATIEADERYNSIIEEAKMLQGELLAMQKKPAEKRLRSYFQKVKKNVLRYQVLKVLRLIQQ